MIACARRPITLLAAAVLCVAPISVLMAQDARSDSAKSSISVDVNVNKPLGPWLGIYNWFGYDEANYTTTANGQELLRELHDMTPAPVYIRFHHLLTSGNGTPELKWSSTNVYSEGPDGKPIYNFAILDGIFDGLKAAGVRPMVEFGFMPKDLAADLPSRHEPYQVHFPGNTVAGASNNPPKDYARWRDLVRAVTTHFVERYGRDAVLQWYFEVWNEPDIAYWHGSMEDYFKLYDYTVAGVRAALPGARVGGPATTGPGSARAADYLRHFLEHVTTGRSAATGEPIPLDFISFHVKGSPTIHDGEVRMGLEHELTDADRGFAIIGSFPGLRNLPVILSEADPEGCAACSSRQNQANNYRNGTLYPAYTAAAYAGLMQLAARHHVHLISMLSWSFEFEGKDYFEGFRSLATNGIDKPILNFFRMAGLMSGDRVEATSSGSASLDELMKSGGGNQTDLDVLATRNHSSAAVLIWNYEPAATTSRSDNLRVTIRGIPPAIKHVLVTQYRIDNTHSNAYTVWKDMGSPQHPTPEQLVTLRGRDGLELLESPQWVESASGVLRMKSQLQAEGLSLLKLEW